MDSSNGVPVGMLPGVITTAGLLGQLDLPLQQQQQQQPQRPMFHRQQQQQQQRAIPPLQQALANDGSLGQTQLQIRQASYSSSSFVVPFREQQPMNSEDQRPTVFGEASTAAAEGGDTASKRGYAFQQTLAISPSRSSSPSPWHRMKWTDSMVRLLISVVYRVGDDGEQQTGHASSAKSTKKSSAPASASASASALLQKKGKWKSVSQAMMEKGFYVSPQQCEDKFNDLNKRYKRVTDLLGKGTACRVVENQALLDTMDHLTPKAKEEARKLLNSKHLFFPEMCAYHNAGGGGGASSSHGAAPPPQQMLFPTSQQHCFHHLQGSQGETAATAAAAAKVGTEEEGTIDDEDDDLDSEEDGDYNDEDVDDEDDEEQDHLSLRDHHHQHKCREADQEDEDSKGVMKKAKATSSTQHPLSSTSPSPPLSLSLSSPSSAMQQLRSELTAMSGTGGEQQQRQWLRKRGAELEEQRVGYQCRAFQLERQRFKWLRFSTNKERQMERMKIENNRLRLENDRMVLLLRQKELELIYGGSNGAAHYPSAVEK